MLEAVDGMFPQESSSSHDTATNRLDFVPLNAIVSRTGVAEFYQLAKQCDGGFQHLERVLRAATVIVSERVQLHQDVASHCALDARTIWCKIKGYPCRTPAETTIIAHWKQNIRNHYNIDYYLSLADSIIQKYSGLFERIQRAWGKPVNLTIPEGLMPLTGRLSKPLM